MCEGTRGSEFTACQDSRLKAFCFEVNGYVAVINVCTCLGMPGLGLGMFRDIQYYIVGNENLEVRVNQGIDSQGFASKVRSPFSGPIPFSKP